jgi:hypothetical protein
MATPKLMSQDVVALSATAEPLANHMATVQATIRKVFDGYKVAVTMRQDGPTRALAERTVATYSEAEVLVKAFAARHEVPWEEVDLVSR